LIAAGGSIIIIQHNLDLIKCADCIIDLGPVGGADGGSVVAVGPPSAIVATQQSHTGRFLSKALSK